MKLVRLFVVMVLVAGAALPARAENVTGIWLRDDNGWRMRIAPCGRALCGTLIWTGDNARDSFNPDPKLRERALVGLRVFADITANEQGAGWAGQVYNPEDGRSFTAKFELLKDKLQVQGCVNGGFICRSWLLSRVN